MADQNGDPPGLVKAVGTAAGATGSGDKSPDAQKLEAAMAAAVQQALNEGVQDQEQIRARIMAARDAHLAEQSK